MTQRAVDTMRENPNTQAIAGELRRWHSLKGIQAFLDAAEAIDRLETELADERACGFAMSAELERTRAELDTKLSGHLANAKLSALCLEVISKLALDASQAYFLEKLQDIGRRSSERALTDPGSVGAEAEPRAEMGGAGSNPAGVHPKEPRCSNAMSCYSTGCDGSCEPDGP